MLELQINGRTSTVDVEGDTPLLWVLREQVGLTGTNEYTCVFLDVVLPGIDGYQVCKMIKANKQAMKKTAVVMLTSRSSPFDKLRGSLAGCDEYLTKPLDEDRLLEVIAQFLPSSRKRDKSGASKK